MASRRSYTLLELLVVMAIISILLGISIGVLGKLGKRNELEATTNAVRALLRRARASAQEERWGAVVEVDPARAELRARLRSTITRFRFDAPGQVGAAGSGVDRDPTVAGGGPGDARDEDGDPVPFTVPGARGYELAVEKAALSTGRLGDGLAFMVESAWAALPDQPILSPREGVMVELYLYLGRLEEALHEEKPRRDPARAERYARAGEPHRPYAPRWEKYDRRDPPAYTVVRKGRAWGLCVTQDYELEAWVGGTHPDKGEVTWIGRSKERTLAPERWYRIAFAFDGERARAIVDGIPRHLIPLERHEDLPRLLMRDPAPLTLSDSHPDRGLFGVVDELVFSSVVSSEALRVPADVALFATDPELGFDLLGQLDPARHAEPFVIWLSDDVQACSAMDPPAAGKAGGGTRTRAEAEQARNLGLGRTPFARFEALAPSLPPERVKRVVVERTGLVR